MATLITTISLGELGFKPTTQIIGYPFNSLYKKDGKTYGISSNGLFEITGANFNGAPINSKITTFRTNLNSFGIKRLRYFYFQLYTEGSLKITVYADDDKVQELYIVPTKTGEQYIRIKAGRGSKFNFLHLDIENLNGCAFSLYTVHVLPQYSSRNVLGG